MIEKEKNCIIIHGCPSDKEKAIDPETRTHDKHWIPWTKEKLNEQGIKTEAPLMSEPWEPVYEKFKEEFEKLSINENTILIGHSCGCTFLVRWLGDTKKKINKLVLVAPWTLDDDANEFKKVFYTFQIDETIKDRVNEIIIFTADNEREEGKEGLKIFHEALGGKIIELKGHGHYIMEDMGTDEFPELIEEVQKEKPVPIVKRILLSSGRVFSTQNSDTIFPKPLREMRVAYITTAGHAPDLRDLSYMEERRAEFVKQNFNVEEISLEDYLEDTLREKLKDFEAIIVEGGNVFYLLRFVRESGFDKVIKELIDQGVIYIGSSAGTYLACPTVEVADWKEEGKLRPRYGITDFTGLGLVDFLIKAHYTPEKNEIVREKMKTVKYPVHILTDEQAILMEDGEFKFLGGPEIKIESASAPLSTSIPSFLQAPESSASPSSTPLTRPQEWSIMELATQLKEKLKSLLGLANKKRSEKVEKNLEKIMAFALEHNRINNKDVRALTGVKDERAREYLDKLEKQGKLTQFGAHGSRIFYMPIQPK